MADADVWTKRVAAWRSSELDAAEFSRDKGYSPSTLQWWSSKLKRDAGGAGEVRIARVLRRESADAAPCHRSTIVIEAVGLGARITVEADVDRKALSMVFELLGIGACT